MKNKISQYLKYQICPLPFIQSIASIVVVMLEMQPLEIDQLVWLIKLNKSTQTDNCCALTVDVQQSYLCDRLELTSCSSM